MYLNKILKIHLNKISHNISKIQALHIIQHSLYMHYILHFRDQQKKLNFACFV